MTRQPNSSGIRFGIGFKLGVILATFGVLASGLTGYYSYSASRGLLVKSAEMGLLTSTQVLGRRLSIALGEVAEDARLLANLDLSAQVARDTAGTQAEARKAQIADTFASLLAVHPEYFQARLIGARENRMELVRVDRDRDKLKRVIGADLQEKGYYPYVFQGLRREKGQVYLSQIIINHEQGAHSGLDKPTLQVSTPVESEPGRNAGLIVINVDLNGLFALLKTDLPDDFRVYLTNEGGDFLIHPDASQTFGFDRGRRILAQDAFASIGDIVQGRADSMVIRATAEQGGENLAAFVKLAFGDPHENRFVILGLSQPVRNVLLATRELAVATLQMVAVFSVLAIILAVLVARALTGPLNAMVGAARRYSDDQTISELPVTRNDELGLLARSFREMQDRINAHISQLHESQRDIVHLARHDALTGLANRLLLHDRLEHAIAGSQRAGRKVALIFIDLDRFKPINDTLGHAVGDEVLKAVAHRLKNMVREADTVARLGGDEFVILIESFEDPRQVGLIAQKVVDSFRLPLKISGHEIRMGASIGIGMYPEDGNNASALLDKADMAMYRAKKIGGDTYRFCSSAVTEELRTNHHT